MPSQAGHTGFRYDVRTRSSEPAMSTHPPQPPRVSVALCVYNGEKHLREQLDTVLAQRGVDLEVIAVDDGSRDGSVALLREAAARDPRLQVHVNPENLGPLRSFERAMSLGGGEFVAPCDQDDRWHPDKLAQLLACIGDADLAYCDSEYIDDGGRPSGRGISSDLTMMSGREPMRFVFSNSVSGHALIVRRALFEAARPFPPGLFHDWWLAMCASARGGVAYLDEALVQFRRHDAAFSPLGKDAAQAPPSRNRVWLEERRALLRALAGSAFDRDGRAAAMLHALEQAEAGRGYGPLLRSVWQSRAAAPPWRGSTAINALRLQSRFIRKLRRARKEPPIAGPRFRL
ncbi:glycosyltransferase [Luteimonas sp. SX5]|uniref:Glycosyltransferase n=1 Tax=Luteimonas galliterrae TaxID=2940486 RepID=A0ABT0MN91_9GAMM|nr:glycosyltransferase [Luteimonas galliterrae]MCL1635725.1 glycosyltransferase [Luteimonas galliterrae]